GREQADPHREADHGERERREEVRDLARNAGPEGAVVETPRWALLNEDDSRCRLRGRARGVCAGHGSLPVLSSQPHRRSSAGTWCDHTDRSMANPRAAGASLSIALPCLRNVPGCVTLNQQYRRDAKEIS